MVRFSVQVLQLHGLHQHGDFCVHNARAIYISPWLCYTSPALPNMDSPTPGRLARHNVQSLSPIGAGVLNQCAQCPPRIEQSCLDQPWARCMQAAAYVCMCVCSEIIPAPSFFFQSIRPSLIQQDHRADHHQTFVDSAKCQEHSTRSLISR
jgi:hypothetical protein